MPGTNPAEAMRVIAGELPDFPHIPELPDRGPGADLTGRTAALLVDLPVEVTPRGWRLAERPGRDLARARSMLTSDLDVLEEVLQGFTGPVKIQLCGPWTLAATLELTRTMNVALSDPGAVADLTASLAEAAAAHAADVARRVPGGRLVVQFDEPLLPSVTAGLVPTQSGLSRLAAVEADTARDRLSQVLAATPSSSPRRNWLRSKASPSAPARWMMPNGTVVAQQCTTVYPGVALSTWFSRSRAVSASIAASRDTPLWVGTRPAITDGSAGSSNWTTSRAPGTRLATSAA
jgi:hypothetical protein